MSEYNTIIEQIHAEYVESTDVLTAELIDLTEKGGREKALEREKDAKTLQNLGFENFAEVKTSLNVDDRIKELQNMRSDAAKYALKYPLYKFITETSVNRINEKYNLRFGRAKSFIGSIPEKNQKEIIEAAKAIKEEDRIGLTTLEWRLVDSADKVLKTIEISLEEIKQAMEKKPVKTSLDRLRSNMAATMGMHVPTMAQTWDEYKHLQAQKWLLVRDNTTIEGTISARAALDSYMTAAMENLVSEVGNKFLGSFVFITAPLDEFSGPTSATVSELEVSDEATHLIPDPIVLFEVKTTGKERGFLIASAWGDEASDEEVVNPLHN